MQLNLTLVTSFHRASSHHDLGGSHHSDVLFVFHHLIFLPFLLSHFVSHLWDVYLFALTGLFFPFSFHKQYSKYSGLLV